MHSQLVCRQEDAQEFLSFVIDRMHEEILRLQGKDSPVIQSGSSVASIEDDDWEMVGPKNRSAVTRTHTFSESAITDIFGGQLRSVVKTKGMAVAKIWWPSYSSWHVHDFREAEEASMIFQCITMSQQLLPDW